MYLAVTGLVAAEQNDRIIITLPDQSPFAFAGLWETWQDKNQQAAAYQSCTIITRAATGAMINIHHRMPVILHPAAYDAWLDPEKQDPGELNEILRTNALTDLVYQPVSKQVNSVRNNDPSNIKPVQTEFDF